ncbi:hypothetical protein DDZ16_08345 [Marinilabilia rubra]|uniref:Uncharacterized protein n=2 Tax=Marinilabilia rubra TaxID=2162893 RepID=A0A2U2B9Y7_9BACT|nr:hypothetical protein DDZ16_08345 [Marinilabilia rubra]
MHIIRKFLGCGVKSVSEVVEVNSPTELPVDHGEPDLRQFSYMAGAFTSKQYRYFPAKEYNAMPEFSSDVLAYTHIEDELLKDLGLSRPEKDGSKSL